MEGAKEAVLPRTTEHNLEVSIRGCVSASFMETVGSYKNMGFQATKLAKAIEIFDVILQNKTQDGDTPITLYLSMSYQLIFSPVRECIAFLLRKRIIDVVIVPGGVIEADIGLLLGGEKCTALEKFEEWMHVNVIDSLSPGHAYSPSEFCRILGKSVEDAILRGEICPSHSQLEKSIAYWAFKNEVPIYVPSWSDGTMAEILCGLPIIVDLVRDVVSVNKSALNAQRSAMIIIGGGVSKHHTCNANLMRNGADYAIYLNTGEEYDGSDGGASPDEAISWGKIKADAMYAKVHCDAKISFPIILAKWAKKL
ncbi:deoxyhypusine synthase [Perkinsela sp. CCAP 1560/4]|nr:deoxyhypusine synthase [Perkinsela sp. CCAP 1560/4]|eukprot:KNH04052.1 deoxyhypusine synthase [Perkinsela sp. CCAP 1560/4]